MAWPWSGSLRWYPTPTLMGSHRVGLILALPLSWAVGQYLTLRLLSARRERRGSLRLLTYLAVVVLAALYVVGYLAESR